ncbi:unnamed protein product [Urochloa decumbens]|uniref:F-box domain-containing protein n=1 Tax=Urochloa decumbens TaxID=240449 RepID=A0ABC9C0Y2_9POAL
MVRGGRRPSSPAPEPNPSLEVEDLLGQHLLRLPPRPSSLPRASLVCKQWRRLLSDPHFLRRFRGRQAKPPLLGFFSHDFDGCKIEFTPALDPPDRVPPALFFLALDGAKSVVLGCRHGRVLAVDWACIHILIWDPASGDRLPVVIPPVFDYMPHTINGAIVCAAGNEGHAHGDCSSNPFQVIMVGSSWEGVYASVYSSAADAWGNLVSALWPSPIPPGDPIHPFFSNDCPSTLVGNCVYWLLIGWSASILEFDLGAQSLAIIEAPPNVYQVHAVVNRESQFLFTSADGGELGFLVFSVPRFSAQLWKRDGIAGWVLGNTIELSNLLSLTPSVDTAPPKIVGFFEGDNAIITRTYDGVFMVYLEPLLFKKLSERMAHYLYHPFASFYPGGT